MIFRYFVYFCSFLFPTISPCLNTNPNVLDCSDSVCIDKCSYEINSLSTISNQEFASSIYTYRGYTLSWYQAAFDYLASYYCIYYQCGDGAYDRCVTSNSVLAQKDMYGVCIQALNDSNACYKRRDIYKCERQPNLVWEPLQPGQNRTARYTINDISTIQTWVDTVYWNSFIIFLLPGFIYFAAFFLSFITYYIVQWTTRFRGFRLAENYEIRPKLRPLLFLLLFILCGVGAISFFINIQYTTVDTARASILSAGDLILRNLKILTSNLQDSINQTAVLYDKAYSNTNTIASSSQKQALINATIIQDAQALQSYVKAHNSTFYQRMQIDLNSSFVNISQFSSFVRPLTNLLQQDKVYNNLNYSVNSSTTLLAGMDNALGNFTAFRNFYDQYNFARTGIALFCGLMCLVLLVGCINTVIYILAPKATCKSFLHSTWISCVLLSCFCTIMATLLLLFSAFGNDLCQYADFLYNDSLYYLNPLGSVYEECKRPNGSLFRFMGFNETFQYTMGTTSTNIAFANMATYFRPFFDFTNKYAGMTVASYCSTSSECQNLLLQISSVQSQFALSNLETPWLAYGMASDDTSCTSQYSVVNRSNIPFCYMQIKCASGTQTNCYQKFNDTIVYVRQLNSTLCSIQSLILGSAPCNLTASNMISVPSATPLNTSLGNYYNAASQFSPYVPSLWQRSPIVALTTKVSRMQSESDCEFVRTLYKYGHTNGCNNLVGALSLIAWSFLALAVLLGFATACSMLLVKRLSILCKFREERKKILISDKETDAINAKIKAQTRSATKNQDKRRKQSEPKSQKS